jgi:hypothetical protein
MQEKVLKKMLKTGSREAGWYTTGRRRTPRDMVKIDYPEEGEVITSHQYTFRISTGTPGAEVDVSIDGSNWMPCRESLGHWWFDWNTYKSKRHALHARVYAKDGGRYVSSLRRFIVKLK